MADTMTLDEANRRLDLIAQQLYVALLSFERESGLQIEYIDLRRGELLGGANEIASAHIRATVNGHSDRLS